MPILPDTAKALVRAGANLVIEESTFIPATLNELVMLARTSGSHITIRNSNLLPSTMQELAELGSNRITFFA